MNIVIRTDASHFIGIGHVMRCLTLAQQLREKGGSVSFACRPQVGDLIDYILKYKFEVIRLQPVVSSEKFNYCIKDYINWLQRSIQDDALDFLACARDFDIVITDHYAIGKKWQSIVRDATGCKIVAIDDLKREHEADLLIDQTFGRNAAAYSTVKTALTGSLYAIVQPMFANVRENAYDRLSMQSPTRVLVSMGGVDGDNVTLSVVKHLSTKSDLAITVTLSPRAPHYKSVASFCSKNSNIVHVDFVEDMASTMINNDIAIGAPGATSWERACLGLPSIMIPIAENQIEIARIFQEKNASVILNLSQLDTELSNAIDKIESDWHNYRLANLSICDGLGVYRVVAEIEQLFKPQSNWFRLVPATKLQIDLVFQWQIDPRTRKYALNSNPPLWDEHVQWMENKIAKVEDYFYIIIDVNTEKNVGVVRLDRISRGNYLVSIFVDPEHYGKGVAQNSLVMVDKIHPHISIHATVLGDNSVSQRLFEKAGYNRISPESFIRNPIA
jgi:UDP-2,4-diacetamido-2,4,6-trideoxy-beta-L-altropyranose hydrolase